MRRFLPLFLATAFIYPGCRYEDDAERVEPLPLEQVPPKIMAVAQAQYPDIKFETVLKGTIRGKEGYEVRGKSKSGKIREVEIAADGTILDVE